MVSLIVMSPSLDRPPLARLSHYLCDVPLQSSPAMDEVSPSSTSSFEMIDVDSAPPTYQMVQPHWFYCRRADEKDSWLPFSLEDSGKLEESFANGKGAHTQSHTHTQTHTHITTNISL